MTYEIYSLGDARYLAQVLNAVAALGGDGTYASLVSFSLLLGILIVAIQSIVGGGQKFDLQIFVVSVVAYQVIFVPRATVIVNDVYTGQAEVVGNVPWGLAFVGSFLNQVGYSITEKMEQAFSTPTMTTNGFGGALANLMNANRITSFGLADYGCDSSPPSDSVDSFNALSTAERKCSISKSVSAYVEACVAPAIRSGDLQASAIYNSNKAIEEMAVNYRALTTGIYIYAGSHTSGDPPADGWTVACADAYTAIKTRIDSTKDSGLMNNYLKGILGGDDPTVELGNSLLALSNSAYEAQDLMVNMAIRNAVQDGFTAYANRNDAVLASAMLTAGNMQRNVQWAGEATLFSRLIRPLITFFEALMFATAPFVAFLIGLGTFGFKLAMKYLYLPIWVNMWMPVMAIVNLYVNMVAQGRMGALDLGAAGSVISIAGSTAMYSSLADWLGTASMLASSVPAITMSLLFGGAVSMSAMAGRLQQGDFTNEKLTAPDVANPAAAMNVESTATVNRLTGPQATGSNAFLPSLSLDNQLRTQMSGQSTVAEAALAQAGQTLGTQLTSGSARNLSTADLQKVSGALKGSSSEAVRKGYDQLVRELTSAGVDQSKVEGVAAQVMLEMGASGKLGAGASAEGASGSRALETIKDAMSDSRVRSAQDANVSPGGNETVRNNNQTSTGNERASQTVNSRNARGNVDGRVEAQAGVRAQRTESERAEVAQGIMQRLEKAVGANLSQSLGADLAKQLVNERGTTDQQQFLKNLGVTDTDTVQQSLSKAREERTQLSQVAEAGSGANASRKLDGNALATLMASGPNAKATMGAIDNALASNPELRNAYQQVMDSGQLSPNGNSIFLGDANKEKAAAFMIASSNALTQASTPAKLDNILDSRQNVLQAAGLVAPNARPSDYAPEGLTDAQRAGVNGVEARAANAGANASNASGVREDANAALAQPVALSAGTPNPDVDTPESVFNAGAAQAKDAAVRAGSAQGQQMGDVYEQRVKQGLDAPSNNGPGGGTLSQTIKDIGAEIANPIRYGFESLFKSGGENSVPPTTITDRMDAAREEASMQFQNQGVPERTADVLARALNENVVRNMVGDAGERAARFMTGSDAPTTMESLRKEAFEGARADYMAAEGLGNDYDQLTPEQQLESDKFANGVVSIATDAAKGGDAGAGMLTNVVGYYHTRTNGIDGERNPGRA